MLEWCNPHTEVKMAIFLRGNIWWMEYRTRSERVVKATGFPKEQKKDAQAVLDAFRLARRARPPRPAMEKILEAIYSKGGKPTDGICLESVWQAYVDWQEGKGRKLAQKNFGVQKGIWAKFLAWARDHGLQLMEDVDVAAARRYVAYVRDSGRSNKTLRNLSGVLGHIWVAIDQLRGGLHNPWPAACPDNDGSSVRLEAFTREQEAAVLAACDRVGNDWRLASIIARWTGLRYGDVANLEWVDIDWERGVIDTLPNKTKKYKVRVVIPMAKPLETALRARVDEGKNEGFILPRHALRYPRPQRPPFSDVLTLVGLDINRYTFHSWRHTFRTRLAEAGVSDDIARRLGGWTNLDMAAHYDHAQRTAELRSAVDKMQMCT
jgi:integrase